MNLKVFLFFFISLTALNYSFAQTNYGTGYNEISETNYKNLQVSVVTYNGTKPETFTNWQNSVVPEAGAQGHENSCNGWGLGYDCMTITYAQKNNWSIYDSDGKMDLRRVFSPAYLYNSVNHGKNNGSDILTMLEFAKTTGNVPWEYFPYVNGQYNLTPPDSLKKIAAHYRITDYARIDMDEESIKSHLLNGFPVIIAIRCYDGMTAHGHEAYKNKTPYFFEEYAKDKMRGIHCICIIGYDDTIQTPYGKGAFLVQNSWGQEWGTKGRFFISYNTFTKKFLIQKTRIFYMDL